ncbi:hypothetical protein JXA34_03620 [Patescibacteria group bacterium]|nr:hypothetical protein [Patescibacteria group bacterium]
MLEKVYAVVSSNSLTNTGFNDVSTLSSIFTWIVNLIIGAGWSIVIIMVAMGFLQYAMSQGDKGKVETAQKWLTYAVVGGLGLALVTAIRAIIQNLSGGAVSVNGVTIG